MDRREEVTQTGKNMENVRTGKLIAELRKKKGLTQQALAEQMNLSNKTVSKWESGAGSPDISNLPVLADLLGVTVDELLRGKVCEHDARCEPEKQREKKAALAPEQKKERAILALAMCIGAVLGILAYNYGWLG